MCAMFLNESLPSNRLDNCDPNSLRFALEKNDVTLPKRSVADSDFILTPTDNRGIEVLEELYEPMAEKLS
jgi:hypothetical protein